MDIEVLKKMEKFLPVSETGRITHFIEKGQGSWYWDTTGKQYLDFTSGIFTNSFGHGDTELASAMSQVFGNLGNIHGRHWCKEMEIYEKLFAYLPDEEYRVIAYGDGGGYTVDRAQVELYYYFQKRPYRMMTFTGGFHGKTQGTKLSISQTQDSTYFYSETMEEPNCYRCPCQKKRGTCSMECVALTEKRLEEFGAEVFLFEPILGANVIVPPKEYWKRLQQFCTQRGILMVADEVLTGGGRTGTFFASTQFGISPDILITTKGLANGLPLSLLFLKKELTENEYARREGNYSSTFMGVPALLAVLDKVLDKIEEEHILENVRERGKQLLDGLERLKSNYSIIGDVRGIGLMVAVEFVDWNASEEEIGVQGETIKRSLKVRPTRSSSTTLGRRVFEVAEKNGLALIHSGNVLRLAPPLNVTAGEIVIGLEKLEKSIQEVIR